jgi:hypothetical protein
MNIVGLLSTRPTTVYVASAAMDSVRDTIDVFQGCAVDCLPVCTASASTVAY